MYDYPIQASPLLFPIRAVLAPYLVGGVGWYSQQVEQLGPTQTVLESDTVHRVA